jgi:hypothetical protein
MSKAPIFQIYKRREGWMRNTKVMCSVSRLNKIHLSSNDVAESK